MRRFCSVVFAVIVAGLAGACDDSTDPGDTVEIRMEDNEFDPATRSVTAGTRVRWVNEGDQSHNTTSDDGDWQSSNLSPGQSFERTFTTPGTYEYSCTLHPGMEGTITVAGS